MTKASRAENGLDANGLKMSRAGKAYLAAFQAGLAAKGETSRPYGPEGAEVRAVNREDVRAEFYPMWRANGDTDRKRQEARRKAFDRGEDELLDAGLIAARETAGGNLVWLVGGAQDV